MMEPTKKSASTVDSVESSAEQEVVDEATSGLNLNIGKGLIVDYKTLEANPNTAKAIVVEQAGIGVNAGNGLVVTCDQLTVLPNVEKAITVDADGVGVNAGNGLQVSYNQLTVLPNVEKAVTVDADGVGVNAGNGLQITANQLAAHPNTAKGIVVEAAGIGVNFGNGLQLSTASQLTARPNATKCIVVEAAGIGVNVGTGLARNASNQLVVLANASKGITSEAAGVGLAADAWKFILARAYGATLAAYGTHFTAFAAAYSIYGWNIYILPRAGVVVYSSNQYPAEINKVAVSTVAGTPSYRTGAPADEKLITLIGYQGTLSAGITISLPRMGANGTRFTGETATFQTVT